MKSGKSKSISTSLLPYIAGAVIIFISLILTAKGLFSPAPSPTPTGAPLPSQTPFSSPLPTPTNAPDMTPAPPSPTPDDSGYTTIRKSADDIFEGKLILINNAYAYHFPSKDDNVCLYNYKSDAYKVGDFTIYLSQSIVPSLNNMLNDFYSATGVNASLVVSGLRTYDYQQGLFDKEVLEVGAAEAVHWVASPGHSEHHSGLALDFAVYYDDGSYYEYDGGGDFAWINSNCHKYGFIVRYQDVKKDITGIYFEPWHFRYIGVPHATQCTRLGLCFEEYIEYLRGFSYSSPLTIRTDDGSVYETYFCGGLTVHVPKAGSYEISGNNIDGFIVTVKVS